MKTYLCSVLSLVALALSSSLSWGSEVSYVWNEVDGFIVGTSCVSQFRTNATIKSPTKSIDHVIEISDVSPSIKAPFTLLASFWQMVGQGDEVLTVACAETRGQTHTVYEVHLVDTNNTVLRVGLSANSASLFKYIKHHSADEAEAAYRSKTSPDLTSLRTVVDAIEGDLDYVICSKNKHSDVYSEDLTQILFQVHHNEPAKLVQSFGTNLYSSREGTFVRVQFPGLPTSSNSGFVAEALVKLRAECEGPIKPAHVETLPTAWVFPTLKRPSESYLSGMRAFEASRSGGRRHAACDLYRTTNEAAVSVAAGKVVRSQYYFYQGTYAIEVEHVGGKVARYGEITGKSASGTGINQYVKAGQTIGYIGKVNSGCCTPMLHFEIYSGTADGDLTRSGNKFNRRSDLLDPSPYLRDWERAKFGTSY